MATPPASSSPNPPVDVDALRKQGRRDRQAHRRAGRHGQGAQGRHPARLRQLPRPQPSEVEETTGASQDKTGAKKVMKFKNCIIAAGSAAGCTCPSCRAMRASWIPPARSNCARCRARCWSSAAASSAWRWPRSTPRWRARRRGRDARPPDAGPDRDAVKVGRSRTPIASTTSC